MREVGWLACPTVTRLGGKVERGAARRGGQVDVTRGRTCRTSAAANGAGYRCAAHYAGKSDPDLHDSNNLRHNERGTRVLHGPVASGPALNVGDAVLYRSVQQKIMILRLKSRRKL